MSDSTNTWPTNFTPESIPPSLNMPEHQATVEDDWGSWGVPKQKKKKSKKSAFDFSQMGSPPPSPPKTDVPQSSDVHDQTTTSEKPVDVKQSDTKAFEELIIAFTARLGDLESKVDGKISHNVPTFPSPPPPFFEPARAGTQPPNTKPGPPSTRKNKTSSWDDFPVINPWPEWSSKPRASLKAFNSSISPKMMSRPYWSSETKSFHLPPPPPPPPPIGTIEPMEDSTTLTDDRSRSRSRPTNRRRRRYSPSRSRSPSPSSVNSSIVNDKIVNATSHADLILCSESGEVFQEDMTSTILPFNRQVYVSFHDATSVDFNHYLLLLKYAQPDHWYTNLEQKTLLSIADAETIARKLGRPVDVGQIQAYMSANDKGACPQPPSFPRGCCGPHESSSGNGTATRINAGLALRLLNDDPVCECKQRLRVPDDYTRKCRCRIESCSHGFEDGGQEKKAWYPCTDCHREGRLPRSECQELKYLSVLQAFQHDIFNPASVGTPLYKVVCTGSRQAAAAQAFYDAGAMGWSTVFVCAVPARASVLSETEGTVDVVGLRHARSIDEVLVHEDHYHKEWLRVLY